MNRLWNISLVLFCIILVAACTNGEKGKDKTADQMEKLIFQ